MNREEWARSDQGKKAENGRCGHERSRRSVATTAFGQTCQIEDAVDANRPNEGDTMSDRQITRHGDGAAAISEDPTGRPPRPSRPLRTGNAADAAPSSAADVQPGGKSAAEGRDSRLITGDLPVPSTSMGGKRGLLPVIWARPSCAMPLRGIARRAAGPSANDRRRCARAGSTWRTLPPRGGLDALPFYSQCGVHHAASGTDSACGCRPCR